MRWLLDTNVLLRWSDEDNPCHLECANAVEHIIRRDDRPCTCAQCLIEYWVVATRPREVNGLGLSIAEARVGLADVRGVFVCLPEPPDMADRWERIIADHEVQGKQAHDARLVALMLSHGVTHILTLNTADFARYPEITALTPAEILSK